jgi:hypothetical protein
MNPNDCAYCGFSALAMIWIELLDSIMCLNSQFVSDLLD